MDFYYLYFLFSIFIIIFVFDKLISFYTKNNNLMRWYFLHSFGNLLICLYTITPMLKLLSDPIYNIQNPIRFEESTLISAVLHTYHLLFFKCNMDDLVHHLTFVLFGTITHYLVNWGYIAALYHFFICGLPGGIDYLVLGLVKAGKVGKRTRIRLAVELNNWVRAPGIILAWSFGYVWYMCSSLDLLHTFSFIVITFGSVVNAQYYSRQVTLYAGNYLSKNAQ